MQECDDLNELDQVLVRRADHVESFLAFHRDHVRCPIYTSVDIRRNANKAAVVDANAFPAGFNNLAPRSRHVAADVARGYLGRMDPGARHVLVVAESHTRNQGYFAHLAVLRDILQEAGYGVTLGTLSPEVMDGAEMPSPAGRVRLHRIRREGDRLWADGRPADLVVLNNDLSEGIPPELQGLGASVTPPPAMGWHRRRKSEHFAVVAQMAAQLGAKVGFDPWLISADFERVDGLDFKGKGNLDVLAAAVDTVIGRVQAKYDAHGIRRAPSVFVKADAGTYGMAITTARSGADLIEGLNSRGREQMDRGKGRVKTTSVIVQEGVPTDIRGGAGIVAEPVIYMVCSRTVGGFYRAHADKGDADNLNSPGSRFEPLAFPEQGAASAGEVVLDPCSAHVYRVLGEIASIATGYEAQFVGREARLPRLIPRRP
ncbi:MAG TPA: glutamate--cysteine ligase [Candidatus Thermoplasmatota archaeon]|nr:glutamate--cysteine ligase [Candidatus Thermoplasmatota archaeon]